MRRPPYDDERLIMSWTQFWLNCGCHCLQAHILGENEREHCEWLLHELDPPKRARVLDIGCGVGGVADQMRAIRPDLRFTLLNVSPGQLALASSKHDKVCGDMEQLPFDEGEFDCALICYALGHGEAGKVIREAMRVAGVVLIYDVNALDRDAWRTHLLYTMPSWGELMGSAPGAKVEVIKHPDGGRFEDLIPGFWARTGAYEYVMRI
jgi:ubiquinone/menaquinone biosynthesis C-methylase UbiE